MKIISTEEKIYFIGGNLVMCREYGLLPNQLPARGYWVLRDINTGSVVDSSRYSNDLLDKYRNVEQ